jgi:hypothetical protein
LVDEIKRHGPCTASESEPYNLRFARKPLEIRKHSRNDLLSEQILLSAQILRCQRSSKEIEKIASLLSRFTPTCRRRRGQTSSQPILSRT